jgi:hypothetical protein
VGVQEVRISGAVLEVHMTCTTDWAYTWHIISGSGKAKVHTQTFTILIRFAPRIDPTLSHDS